MAFDAKEYLASFSPPEFVAADGTRYVGRILSHEQWLPFEQRFHKLGDGEADYQEIFDLTKDLSRAMFPKPWWKFWKTSVTRQLLKLPPMAWLAALAHFRQAQARHYGLPISATGLSLLDEDVAEEAQSDPRADT